MPGGSGLRPAAVLVASDCESTSRALLSVLASQGYAVDHVRSGRETVDVARTGWPSAVIVDANMPDMLGVEVCRALRGDPLCAGATPVILINADGARRADRLAAFGAGAWEICPRPVDGALLLVKLETFVHARQAAERLRAASLLDAEVNVYNLNGLLMRARELQAFAVASREPVACIGFSTRSSAREATDDGPSPAQVVRTCHEQLRATDVLGRIGPAEFAILATGTGDDGAAHLVRRLRTSLGAAVDRRVSDLAPLRVSCRVVADCADPALSVADALLAAASALGAAGGADAAVAARERGVDVPRHDDLPSRA